MELPKRKPARIKGYDYSQNGYYFITICTQNKQKVLSRIVGEGLPLPQLTPEGKIAERLILKVNEKYPFASVNKYVIMPNHIDYL